MKQRSDLLEAMEQVRDFTATMTGIKKQLTDDGWSPLAAEQLVIEMLRLSGRGDLLAESDDQ